jgi:hypothetical protein
MTSAGRDSARPEPPPGDAGRERNPPAGAGARRGAVPTDLLWSEVADAIWLAGRIRASRRDVRRDDSNRERTQELPPSFSPPHPDPIDVGAPSPRDDAAPPPTVARRTTTPAAPTTRSHRAGAESGGRFADPAAHSAGKLARGLRPLRRFVPSAHSSDFDEETTSQRAASDGLWLPVFEPAQERRWNLALVVDDNVSMVFWRDAVAKFAAGVERAGAFRNVVRRALATGDSDPESVVLRTGTGRLKAVRPSELTDPTARTIVVVLTDGIGRAWRSGAVEPLLHRWGRNQPVALLHLLPEQLWYRTGISVERKNIRAPAVGAQMRWIAEDGAGAAAGAAERNNAVLVPVLQLEPRLLRRWADLVSGSACGWTRITAICAPSGLYPRDERDPVRPPEASTAFARVTAFRAAATPQALTLATHLAAAPLNLAVIHAIQRRLLPETRPSHFAEILLFDLIRPAVGRERIDSDESVTFDFDSGVREELLARGRRAETARVLRLVHDVLGPKVDAVRRSARALDEPADRTSAPATAASEPFLRAERAAYRAMSGRYLPRARYLDDLLAGCSSDYAAAVAPSERRDTPERGPTSVRKLTEEDKSDPPGTDPTPRTNPLRGAAVSTTIVGPVTTPRRAHDESTMVGGLPARNLHFTGREDLLARLHDRLMHGPTAVLPEALHGKGGVGKSQLAVEYVYRHLADYDLIWWIPAERQAQIESSLVELAQRLNLNAGNEANTAVPAVMQALREGRPSDRWLLVFDNAGTPGDVDRFFPKGESGPPVSVGRIMVTSRNSEWSTYGTTLEVDVFERDESRSLLQRRSSGLDADEANRLAEALGDLPLAVEQAANWQAVTGMAAAEYLDMLQTKRDELVAEFPELGYELPVVAAWSIALERLEETNKAALQLLGVCSFFAPDPVSWGLFTNVRATSIAPDLDNTLRDRTRLRRAIRQIDRLGLAKVDVERETLQLHRLVQMVVARRLNDEERGNLRHGAHLVLASNDPNDWTVPAKWSVYAELYPHVVDSQAFGCEEAWVRQLVINEAKYLWKWGAHHAARDLAEQTYEAWREKFGDEATETTLTIAGWLGWMYFVVGQFGESAALNAKTYEIYRRIRGEDDEDTLKALGDVAANLRVRGDFQRAAELAEQVRRGLAAAFGDDDPSALNAAHNLGVSLRLIAEYSQALALDEGTWRRKVRVLGPDEDSTLGTLISMNIDRWELGDYRGARKAQEEVVAAYRRVLQDENNPALLFAIRQLAVAVRKAGDHSKAREYAEEVRARYASRYGDDYPETMAAALNLSVDRRQTGDLNAARELGAQTHRRYRQTLGEDHPHTIAAAVNLAVTLRRLEQVDDAYHLNREALAGLRDRLGDDHSATLLCATNLASDAFARGEFEEAEERDREVLARSTARLGGEHPSTLACSANLALDLRAAGRTEEAQKRHTDTVVRLERVLGVTHPATRQASEWQRADCDIDPMPL